MTASLLIEIGCEEIPARMIASGAADLEARVVAVLDQAGLPRGGATSWGGTRRLAVRVEDVGAGLPDSVETVLGPPATAAFGAGGIPTPAGAGFARKQGIDPATLTRIETDKGVYAGFRREVPGRSVAQVLAAALPGSVAAMSFAKTMRWGDGAHRWVRPVHWVLALHGAAVLDLEILGARSGRTSDGHRFLAPGPATIGDADAYVEALRAAHVLVDPAERRAKLQDELDRAAKGVGGAPVHDEALLEEITNLVEWPGVVVGRFDPAFLELPREILVTTLKHHQKSFSVQGGAGLLPAFLSVANTDRDPGGHVRRGNEWVVVGRLDDARFFWNEDRTCALASRVPDLAKVTYHKKLGSYADKSKRNENLARVIAGYAELDSRQTAQAIEAARVAKADLVTGLVGEFPELQGIVGGLLLHADGADSAVSRAVYDHYRPVGADDAIPSTEVGCVVAVADRLDTIGSLLGVGEAPTGSRDPFGIRRAANSVFQIAIEQRWPLTFDSLMRTTDVGLRDLGFWVERLTHYLIERGFTALEVRAVLTVGAGGESFVWPLYEVVQRLESLRAVRSREDFQTLLELTKRIHNIVPQVSKLQLNWLEDGWLPTPANYEEYTHGEPAARALHAALYRVQPLVEKAAAAGSYDEVTLELASLAGPVRQFFDDVLVIDESDRDATYHRKELVARLASLLTRYFDIRELAGQAGTKR